MIPADVASSLRMLLPDQQALTSSTPQTQPVAPRNGLLTHSAILYPANA